MKLNDYFTNIVIITLRGAEHRAQQSIETMLKEGMIDKPSDIVIHYGVKGDELYAPIWWRSGNAAWGCLKSHIRVLEDSWRDGYDSVLIMEDDVCWAEDAQRRLLNFMKEVPSTWGQIYFGGQHQHPPEPMGKDVMLACSVNRTHCYAVAKSSIPKLLAHIQHAPDYMESVDPRHIDHQYEAAHMRGDWEVYCPRYWLAAQEANHSQINGMYHPRMWWDWITKAMDTFPFVIIPKNYEYDVECVHYFEGHDPDLTILGGDRRYNKKILKNTMKRVFWQAVPCRRYPAMREGVNTESCIEMWKGKTVRITNSLPPLTGEVFCNYQNE